MTLEQACQTILGKEAADAIIADQGLRWAATAAVAAARTSDPQPALVVLRDYLNEIKRR